MENEASEMEELVEKFDIDLDDWLHIAIVRDPVERFISGFVDKCLLQKLWTKFPEYCNGCQTNVSCFAEKEYNRMMHFSNGMILNSYDDRHFFPQNWRCQFYEHYERFKFIKHSSEDPDATFQKLYIFLKRQNVSDESIAFIDNQLHSGQTKHTTSSLKIRKLVEKEVYSNHQVMALLKRMYYYDFLLFGFPLPNIPH